MSTLSLGGQREVISLWTRKEDWKLGEITLGGAGLCLPNLSYFPKNNTNFLSFQGDFR